MKRFFSHTLLTVGLSALLGSFAPLGAQTQTQLTADIPFAFHAQGQTMPAGKYDLTGGVAQGVFELTNATAKRAEFVNAPIPKSYMPKESKLTFEQFGNTYVLSEISISGHAYSSAVPPSAIEKNLTRKLGLAGMISVPLRGR